jgi:hypothetical protein
MKLSDKRKRQIIRESFEQDGPEAVRKAINDMNDKAREGLGPNDFLITLSADAMIDSGIDTLDKLHKYFADEDAREEFKASLHRQWDDFADSLSVEEHSSELEPSAEEEEYQRLPKQTGMGRRASMKENKSFGLKEVMSSYMKKCQHLNECGCQMKSPFNAPEDEPQGYMLVQNLEKIAKKAGELTGVAKYTDDAEPWVESKINSAAEHIDAVYDYIKYGRDKKSDMHGEMDHHEDYEEQY